MRHPNKSSGVMPIHKKAMKAKGDATEWHLLKLFGMAFFAYYFPSDRPWLSEQRVLFGSSFNGPWLDATRMVSDPLLGDQGQQG